MQTNINLLYPSGWSDYELIDSGNGIKLERYGPYIFVRPAPQAIWHPNLEEKVWQSANGIFKAGREESGGHWQFKQPLPDSSWIMGYKDLKFAAFTAGSRHMGVFPEQACHWDWIAQKIVNAQRPVQVLNLFGYTGIASLAADQAGAKVTHVDASKKTVHLAQHNQALSGLTDHPIRWIIDDAIKFVRRESRRQVKYDGLIMDPPKFGRGPKGEVWEFFKLMPYLLENCQSILSDNPLFIVITAYALQASALSLYYSLKPLIEKFCGELSCGELALQEKSSKRVMSLAIYARWNS
jgi:23S rRNA (cytosine1962-C5)-methyltransferase